MRACIYIQASMGRPTAYHEALGADLSPSRWIMRLDKMNCWFGLCSEREKEAGKVQYYDARYMSLLSICIDKEDIYLCPFFSSTLPIHH